MAPWRSAMPRHQVPVPLRACVLVCTALLVSGFVSFGRAAQDAVRGRPDDGLNLTVVAGRPTPASLTFSVHADVALEVYVELGTTPGQVSRRTAAVTSDENRPAELTLGSLAPGTRYFYRVRHRRQGQPGFATEPEQMIVTARRGAGAFAFGVQGPSRPDGPDFDRAVYERTLDRARRELLDFYVLLGDDFGTSVEASAQADLDAGYRRQRRFLAPLAASTPLYLVAGSEDGLLRALLDGTQDNPAVRAADARARFFPLPVPDGYYTGDEQAVAPVGLLRDYYAWTWGDALLVVVDPGWWSSSGGDSWNLTLGDTQYQWLRRTLEGSTARYKFIFTHQVPRASAGGVGLAGGFEWGGQEAAGQTFRARRPGWPEPIHTLLARTGVSIVFTGHEGRFASEDVDGVRYQSVPSPSAHVESTDTVVGDAAEARGVGPGHLRVSVSSDGARVDYVRAVLPSDETPERRDGDVAVTYVVTGRR